MKRSPQTFQQNEINKHLCSNVNFTKFFTQDNFCLFINPCSLRDQVIYGSRLRLVNTKDGIQLELNRKTLGSGSLKCHIFIIVITCSMTIECYSLQPKYMLCSSMDLGNILFNALIVEPTNWGMMQFLVNQNWGNLRTADIFPVVPPKNNVIFRRNDWKYICCLQARTAAPSVASLIMLHSSAQHSLKDPWPLRWQRPAIICEQHRVAFWLKVISMNLWRHQFSYCPWWLCSLERCEKAVREADHQASLWVQVLTQQLSSIAKPFWENMVAIMLFYKPPVKTMKAIFEEYASKLSQDDLKQPIARLKEHFPSGIELFSNWKKEKISICYT